MYSINSIIIFISIFICFTLFTNNVLSLQCYNCSTADTPSCHEDKFNPEEALAIDCSKEEPTKNATGCKKWLRRSDKIWIRECVYDIDPKDTTKICGSVIWDWKTFTVRGANYEVCSTCANDLCNTNDKTYYRKLFT